MKFLIMILTDEDAAQARSNAEVDATATQHGSVATALREAGRLVSSHRLAFSRDASTIRLRDGRALFLDGPFAETKEQLGGFYLIDVANLDEAIEAAAKCPGAFMGAIEVRPIEKFEEPQ